jgi:p-aminobenzoyl-glutamate transporter AbgT
MNPPFDTLATVILVLSNLNATATRPNGTLESAQTSSVQGSPAVQNVVLYLIVTFAQDAGVAAIINTTTANAASIPSLFMPSLLVCRIRYAQSSSPE